MKIIKNIFIPVAISLLLLGIIEMALRVSGYGSPSGFWVEQETGGEKVLSNNIFYTERFFSPRLIRTPVPQNIPRERKENTIRIAIAGESAAIGDPDYSFGFGRIMKIILEDNHPDIDFEIVNTSVTAINSHVILPIAKETNRKFKPDVFLIYMGNNEVIGPYGPNSTFSGHSSKRGFIKFNIAINSTKLGMLARNIGFSISGKQLPEQWDGMEMFLNYKVEHGDQRIETIYNNFGKNLNEIIRSVSGNSKVIISTVAVNLRDCSPFYSIQTAPDTAFNYHNELARSLSENGFLKGALDHLEKALHIDNHHAGAHYARAEILYGLGRYEEAYKHYVRSLDLDALKFRADSRINEKIRDIAGSQRSDNVSLVDIAEIVKDYAVNGIAGSELFLEHVHFTFLGNYILADHFVRKIEEELGLPDTNERGGSPGDIGYYKKRLAYTPYEAYNIYREVLGRLDKAPFSNQDLNDRDRERILEIIAGIKQDVPREQAYLDALQLSPDDWLLKYKYSLFMMRKGAYSQRVLEMLGEVKQAVPQNATVDFNMGYWYENHGEYESALDHYLKAIDIFPYYRDAGKNASALLMLNSPSQADRLLASFNFSPAESAAIYLKAGEISAGTENDAHTEVLFRKGHDVDPGNANIMSRLTTLLLRKNDFLAAIDILEEYTRSGSGCYESAFKLGLAYEGLKNHGKALEYYMKAKLIDSTSYLLINKIGQMHYLTEEYSKAIDCFEHSLKINPFQKTEYVYANIARSLSKLGESSRAAAFFEKAVSAAPEKQALIERLND